MFTIGVLKLVLKDLNVKIDYTTDPNLAYKKIEEFKPDIAVIDGKMKPFDGIFLSKDIADKFKNPPKIILNSGGEDYIDRFINEVYSNSKLKKITLGFSNKDASEIKRIISNYQSMFHSIEHREHI